MRYDPADVGLQLGDGLVLLLTAALAELAVVFFNDRRGCFRLLGSEPQPADLHRSGHRFASFNGIPNVFEPRQNLGAQPFLQYWVGQWQRQFFNDLANERFHWGWLRGKRHGRGCENRWRGRRLRGTAPRLYDAAAQHLQLPISILEEYLLAAGERVVYSLRHE
ncbi:MAG: hypothetical protein G01um101431_993 [Parcubacteria group bacterium Gr01-1014_31]|nr:MAG: hypothetical protein G01um101431_993 [Parcubacteria group bacterium Gr01-1014_31]